MTEKSNRCRRRAEYLIAGLSAVVFVVVSSALAAPSPIVERSSPVPVTAVDAEQLETLPANQDLRAILNVHNQLRGQLGARPLRWNQALADNAQRYATILAETGTVQHSSRAGRENERENIVVGPRSGISPVQMVQIWTNERQFFRAGTFPNVCTGDWSKCGHYTQIIWPTTTDLGCGYATGRFDALVCRYSPPGNKDGVAIGPQVLLPTQERAERLCTNARGQTIPCQNAPQGQETEDGGVIDDDGGGAEDSAAEEELACVVDVNVHKPISVEPDEPVVRQEAELVPGSTTLRNDDADWHLAGEPRESELPIVSLPTDVDRQGPNANENDLVKIQGLNPNGLPGVYLFAFPTRAEANRKLKTQVNAVAGGRQASAQELGYYTNATKAGPAPALPVLVPRTTTLWLEARLGGQYRFVIGKLKAAIAPADVRYDSDTGVAYAVKQNTSESVFVKDAKSGLCEDQATVTAAVVDIFQRNTTDKSLRQTAFDVYWGGRPYFRAEVWPGGGAYSWGPDYRIGRNERQMPADAVTGMVAFMEKDAEDARGDSKAERDGPRVVAQGNAPGGFGQKGRIEGGFDINNPGNPVPQVNRNRDNRYPERVSLGYSVNDERLVRAEYLEVILPQVRPPNARPRPVAGTDKDGRSSTRRVASNVEYTIVDAFDRVIKAERVDDYLYLYGAGLKAWEALGEQPNRVFEGGPTLMQGRPRPDRFNDFSWVIQAGAQPIRLGTAQRSQAEMHDNRMLTGTFTDTLIFTAPAADNAAKTFWQVFTGQPTTPAQEQLMMTQAQERSERIRRGQDLASVERADEARVTNSNVLALQQDVILQLRAGANRCDLMVFQNNTLTVFAPYFFDSASYPGDKSDGVFRYHIQFAPGAAASQLVQPPHRRPASAGGVAAAAAANC